MKNLKSLYRESVDDIINDILLSLHGKYESCFVFVLVEGESDHKVYKNFFRNIQTSIQPMWSKENVKIGMERLLDYKEQIIGICDANFDHLNNDSTGYDNLFFTDCHDLEMTMLKSSGVRYAFTEYALQEVPHDAFTGHLMTSFQLSHFMQTMLYQSISAWQTKHGFDILQTVE